MVAPYAQLSVPKTPALVASETLSLSNKSRVLLSYKTDLVLRNPAPHHRRLCGTHPAPFSPRPGTRRTIAQSVRVAPKQRRKEDEGDRGWEGRRGEDNEREKKGKETEK
eukprot:3023159-Rhodomonas_salina.1